MITLGAVVGFGSPAAATTSEPDGQWWYGAYGVEQVHAEGWTGEGIRIAVIDSQMNPDLPTFADADLTIAPGAGCAGSEPTTSEVNTDSRHGSTVTALLVGNGTGAGAIRGIVPDASVTFYGLGTLEGCEPTPEAVAADQSPAAYLIARALADGADLISISQTGGAEYGDAAVIADAIVKKVPIVAGVPNDVFEQAEWPSSFRGVVAVNAVDQDQQLLVDDLDLPNIIEDTTVVAPGSPFSSIGAPEGTWDDSNRTEGSSLATPLVAGILAAAMQKYPEASGDQLIQSLVHNTGPEDHELEFSADDGYGYGVASLGHVLRVDPVQYDDENPLLEKGYEEPDAETIAEAAAAQASAAPAPSDSPDAPAADDGDALSTGLIVGGIVLGVIVISAVILTIVLVRRSHRGHREEQS